MALVKGEATRTAILEHALKAVSKGGLSGLSIGMLATELGLSKSGLFAHFGAKEALEIAVLEYARERFVDGVLSPALKAPRGEARLREVLDRWMSWAHLEGRPGCPFVAAAAELDDVKGPARDVLAGMQGEWLDSLATIVKGAISEGQLRPDTDAEQVAFEVYGVMLIFHLSTRLLEDHAAMQKSRAALDRILNDFRA